MYAYLSFLKLLTIKNPYPMDFVSSVLSPILHVESIILAKISAQKQKTKNNWTRVENFDICFFVTFAHLCQKFITGEQTVSPSQDSPYIYYFPKILNIKSFRNSLGTQQIHVIVLDIDDIQLYVLRIRFILKHSRRLNYYGQHHFFKTFPQL